MTKALTSVARLQLVETDGCVDAPVASIIPPSATRRLVGFDGDTPRRAAVRPATIRHLLTHRRARLPLHQRQPLRYHVTGLPTPFDGKP